MDSAAAEAGLMAVPLPVLGLWIAHVAYWTAASAANVLVSIACRVPEPPAFNIAECGLCFAATAALRQASHRHTLRPRTGLAKLGMIAGGALVSAALVQAVLVAAGPLFGVATPSWLEIVGRFLIALSMILVWCGFSFGYQAIREQSSAEVRALQAETESLRNELRHLQSQITPHFLFNALNTLPAAVFGRISRSLIIPRTAIRATQWQSRHPTLILFHGVAAPMPLDRAGTSRLKELVQS